MRAVVAIVVTVAALAGSAHAASDVRRGGMYAAQGGALPMLDSDIRVRVRGPIVEATITQTFKNDSDRVTEATYIFPLPADAAVSAMSIAVGTRTIHAAIESREAAKQRYESAVSAGLGAGLLEQERADVFTQTVSAIPARGTVVVSLRFDATARFNAGTWELALPLVVAPRYVPGSASGRPTTGAGRAPDTDRAPDASRVTPGGAPGAGGPTSVVIEYADPVTDVTSPTHELAATKAGYAFTDPKSDHDALVRWHMKAATQAWLERDGSGGVAAVLVEQKAAPATRKAPVKIVLVVDHAATTRGDAEAVQRPLVRALLSSLDARDSVAVAGAGKLAFGSAAAAQKTLDERAPGGKTPFDLTATLAAVHDDRAVVLITDGLVADDHAVIAAAAKLRAPVHVIGIGPAPNRSLLAQLAGATGGTVRFATVGDDLTVLARDVLADAASPPERVAVTWGTLGVAEVVPATVPRLGAGQAVLVLAKVISAKSGPKANARAHGDVIGFVDVATSPAPDGATSAAGPLARRWAKLRLDDLLAAGDRKAAAAHALRHGLVSPFTSMVAVGTEVIIEGGVKHTVPVPVSVPGGMQWPLVKEQTTVTLEDNKKNEPVEKSVAQEQDKRQKRKTAAPDDERADKSPARSGAGEGAGVAPGPDGDREEEEPRPMADVQPAPPPSTIELSGAEADEDDSTSESIVMTRSMRRTAVRLSLALGGGVAVTAGEVGAYGALTARAEYGRRRTLVGAEAALQLVDGAHAQGTFLAALSRRGVARRLELGLGVGLRVTPDALGPALSISLRTLLPLRGFAAYLRYDGALLRYDATSTGLNAGSVGIEAHW